MKPKMTKKNYASVNVQTIPIADLSPAEYNSRLITHEALAGLSSSLQEFGLLAFPVVNKRKEGYRIVGGHQRVKVLKEQGVTDVKCVVVEFEDSTEVQANFALNNRAIQGEFIPELTKALLDQIKAATEKMNPELFSDLRFDAMVKQITRATKPKEGIDDVVHGGNTDDDDNPGLSKSAMADSKVGKFYKLGEHVLYCGKAENKSSLSGFPVEHADAAFTWMASKNGLAEPFLDAHIGALLKNTDGPVYIATNFATLPLLQERFVALGGHWSNTLMWLHHNVDGYGAEAYRNATIPVVYGWRDGAPHYFCGQRDQGNVFRMTKPLKVDLPVEVVTKLLLNSTKAGAYVLDTDIGDGTSVIAAEKVNRRIIGFVNNPREMDAVRKRWTAFVHPNGTNWKSATTALGVANGN